MPIVQKFATKNAVTSGNAFVEVGSRIPLLQGTKNLKVIARCDVVHHFGGPRRHGEMLHLVRRILIGLGAGLGEGPGRTDTIALTS